MININKKILSGLVVRDSIIEEIKKDLSTYSIKPILTIISINPSKESLIYINQKVKWGEKAGIKVQHDSLPETIELEVVLDHINKLNLDLKVSGIIVQLPIRNKLDKASILQKITFGKDVDGLRLGSPFTPATAGGILELLNYYKINVESKRVLIIGRSELVGKPLFLELLKKDATVTLAHSKTKNLKKLCLENEIVISAIGKPKYLKKNYFHKNSIVIDVGISRLENGEIVGDVDYKNVVKVVRKITPVPGGIGPLTVACLLKNTYKAFLKK